MMHTPIIVPPGITNKLLDDIEGVIDIARETDILSGMARDKLYELKRYAGEVAPSQLDWLDWEELAVLLTMVSRQCVDIRSRMTALELARSAMAVTA
jgi:hypothetical protein